MVFILTLSFPGLKIPAPNSTFIFSLDQNKHKEGGGECQYSYLESKIYITFRLNSVKNASIPRPTSIYFSLDRIESHSSLDASTCRKTMLSLAHDHLEQH